MKTKFGPKDERSASIRQVNNGYIVEIRGELFSVPARTQVYSTLEEAVVDISQFMKAEDDTKTKNDEA